MHARVTPRRRPRLCRRRTLVASVCLGLSLAAPGCFRDNSKQKGKSGNTSSELQTRVGNDDPRGVDDQPDWERQARELKQRVDPRMPAKMPTDKLEVCTKMVDEVSSFYISIETDPEQRATRMAQLQQTRDSDIAGCVEETSVAAAVCVTILLEDRDSEFPWLLDQCSRAYPSEDHGDAVGLAEPRAERIELTFVGDIIFGRYREGNVFDPIVDPSKVSEERPLAGPFAEIQDALTSDVLVGNLETPVLDVRPEQSPISSSIRFAGGRDDVEMLADAGFAVLNLANNHFYDLRAEGQLQSPKVVAALGLTPIGASRTEQPVFRLEPHEAAGWRIGFAAMTNRINAPTPEDPPSPDEPRVPYLQAKQMPGAVLPLVEAEGDDYDLIVVVVHWGDEYAEAPKSHLQRVAHELIDGGVDMVIGHHPHVLQGIEVYGDGLIAYSLGNFLFEHTGSPPRLTGVLRTAWSASEDGDPCLAEVVFHPAYMQRTPYPHPSAATGGMAKQVRRRVVGQAQDLGTSFVEVEGREDLRVEGLPSCGG